MNFEVRVTLALTYACDASLYSLPDLSSNTHTVLCFQNNHVKTLAGL